MKGKSTRGSQTQFKGGIFENKKELSIYTLHGKKSAARDFKIMERLKINEERGRKERGEGRSKQPHWGNDRKQEETQCCFFLKKWR